MFGLFKKKSRKEKLQAQYEKMMRKAYQLSHTDRRASDAVTAEAEDILKEIESLEKNTDT